MKKNNRLQERRKKISKDVELFVERSFDIVDRIHFILQKQGKEQKDLAKALGKTESEISKWMTGTHNFTIKTLTKIESVLGESILVAPAKEKSKAIESFCYLTSPNYDLCSSNRSTKISHSMNMVIHDSKQPYSKCLI